MYTQIAFAVCISVVLFSPFSALICSGSGDFDPDFGVRFALCEKPKVLGFVKLSAIVRYLE
jgi:hypothetical protein